MPASTSRRIGVLSPMRSELRPVIKAFGLRASRIGDLEVHTGDHDGTEVVAVMAGVGIDAAIQSTTRLLDAMHIDHVVVEGIAGGVSSEVVKVGDLIAPERVLNGKTGAEFRPFPLEKPLAGVLHSSDELVTDDERLADFKARGIVALDMETAGVAEACEARGCPWSVIRVISDMAGDPVLDNEVLRLLRPDGTVNAAAAARLLVTKPNRIRRLAQIGNDAKRATHAASRATVRAVDFLATC